MRSLKSYNVIFVILVILFLSIMASCKEVDENNNTQSGTYVPDLLTPNTLAPNTTDQKAVDGMISNEPKKTMKPGYNPYGIPGGELWQTMDKNGALKENYKEIVSQIKKKWGIPECITGIPWDERAKKLILDDKGNLVNNWEEVVEKLKKEWEVTD